MFIFLVTGITTLGAALLHLAEIGLAAWGLTTPPAWLPPLFASFVALLIAAFVSIVLLRRLAAWDHDHRLAQVILHAARPLLRLGIPGTLAVLALTPWTTLAAQLGWWSHAPHTLVVTIALLLWSCSIWALMRINRAVVSYFSALVQQTDNRFDDVIITLVGRVLRGLIPVIAIYIALRLLFADGVMADMADHAFSITVVASLTWILLQAVSLTDQFILAKYRIDVANNLRARRLLTQAMVAKRIAYVVVVVFGLAGMLTQFDAVRQIGTAMLASAGVASLVIGLAAQRTLGNILAGIQIALTQPINIDDVVIIEGEWGRIEEIHLTYVVVAIWDQRRLVVPINHFLEKPFQNWTRKSADILGTVLLHCDYTLPVEELRSEATRIVTGNPLWDGRVCGVQVTDASERTMEVRVLVSAADASKAWDLRCEMRERLITWLQRVHPDALPRLRWGTAETPVVHPT